MVASKPISAPEASVDFNVIRASMFVSVIAESSIFRTASPNVMVTLLLTAISFAPSTGEKVTLVALASTTVKVAEEAVLALSLASSTVAPIATYTTCSLLKSLVGLIVITFLSVSIVASKPISDPEALVVFRVIKASTFESVSAESSILRAASLNVMVIFRSTATPVAPLAGANVTVGPVISLAVLV